MCDDLDIACMMDLIFGRSKDLPSFWDSKNQKISSKLMVDENGQWYASEDEQDRYGLFTIFCVLFAKDAFQLDTQPYDDKILAYLHYIKKKAKNLKRSDLTYGAFNALVLGQIHYKKQVSLEKEIHNCLWRLMNEIVRVKDNHDILMLIGLWLFLEKMAPEHSVRLYLDGLVSTFLKSQDRNGVFQTGDLRAPYHQRLMYSMWACAIVAQSMHTESIHFSMQKTIDFVWKNRRGRQDNGFIWHEPVYIVKSILGMPVPVVSFRSTAYLFSCHQTFFITAVNLYNKTFQESKYLREKRLALEWITGDNRIGKNLIEVSGIGMPARIVTRNGQLKVSGQHFLGSYEVGAHILAAAGNRYDNSGI